MLKKVTTDSKKKNILWESEIKERVAFGCWDCGTYCGTGGYNQSQWQGRKSIGPPGPPGIWEK